VPLAHRVEAVPTNEVLRDGSDEALPLGKRVGRHGEALVGAAAAERVVARLLASFAAGSKGSGREGELYDGAEAEGVHGVEDLVDVVKLEAAFSGQDSHIVVEQAMAADSAEAELVHRQREL